MKPNFAQYLRVQEAAGGVDASPRQIIKAEHARLTVHGRGPSMRVIRHPWLRGLLEHHAEAQALNAHPLL